MNPALAQKVFSVADYDLAATLASGQAFRWRQREGAWEGVVGSRWVRLREDAGVIIAEAVAIEAGRRTSPAQKRDDTFDWRWLEDFLQLGVDLQKIISTFPDDEPMRVSVAACRGLRLLRQDPWECLASFILSSTKQIVQIQQIVALLCQRFGERVVTPDGDQDVFSFPGYARLARVSESELRDCKMGFRAPYLLGTAKMLAAGEVDLHYLRQRPVHEARAELLRFPGVGNKIADCVLLFAYGFQEAFPVDVWVMKALRELYFPNRRVKVQRIEKFSKTYFGANAGYAQQYLFHYMRTRR